MWARSTIYNEARELSILTEIRNTLTKEEPNIKRVKIGVRQAFQRIADLSNLVLMKRSSLRKARRAVVHAARAKHPNHTGSNMMSSLSL